MKDIAAAHVLERMYRACEIEWPVVKQSRDKKKQQQINRCSERVRLYALRVARRVQQLSQYDNVKINRFSSFFK